DLSHRAADILGYVERGMGNVQVEYVGRAPLNGDDTRMLLASVNRPTALEQGTTRLAMVEPDRGADIVTENAVTSSRGRVDFGDHEGQQVRSRGDYSSEDLAADFFGLFGYAETTAVTGAHAAVNAMASRSNALDE